MRPEERERGDPLSEHGEARPFGRFELLDVLGRGGMGVVYRARERAPGRIVALKLATAHLIAQNEFRLRFQAEVKAAARLDHPHVLPIFEVGEHDGLPFFTMKIAEGGSLAGRLDAWTGKFRESAQLVARVARGVEHAHQRGVLHRDLKPANILLGPDNHHFAPGSSVDGVDRGLRTRFPRTKLTARGQDAFGHLAGSMYP